MGNFMRRAWMMWSSWRRGRPKMQGVRVGTSVPSLMQRGCLAPVDLNLGAERSWVRYYLLMRKRLGRTLG